MATSSYPQRGIRGNGRRKEASARIRLLPGKGNVLINGQSMDLYLGGRKTLHIPVIQPLVSAGVQQQYDLLVNVVGGGKAGQAQAIKLSVARALASMNPEYHKMMRDEGFLTVDARVKERKKYGRKKARKRFQFSKR